MSFLGLGNEMLLKADAATPSMADEVAEVRISKASHWIGSLS